MESIGIPNSPLGLELTIATPAPGNGIHISSSFGSGDELTNLIPSMPGNDGCDGSNIELTIATPAPGNGIHISTSSFCSDVCNGSSNIENAREFASRLLTQSTPAKDVCNGSNIKNPRELGSLLTPSEPAKDGSNIENLRELTLLDTFHLPATGGREEPDVLAISNMEIEGGQERHPAGGSSSRPHKYKRLSQEQRQLLEASFQQNQSPDKGRKEALAETLKMTLNQVKAWFVNRRARLKKQKMEDNEKGLDSYKRQVESLTNETQRLRHKLNKLKKKLNKKHKAPSMAPVPPPQLPEQQQQQVMYVPVLTRFVPNHEHNVATTAVTTALITQQGSASVTAGSRITNALLLPSSDASAI